MNNRKKGVYLSELFLDNLDGDFSHDAVLRALGKCNDEICMRIGAYPCARGRINNFFNREKPTKNLPKQIRQELKDFWDVYSEFDSMLRPGIKKNYLILQIL